MQLPAPSTLKQSKICLRWDVCRAVNEEGIPPMAYTHLLGVYTHILMGISPFCIVTAWPTYLLTNDYSSQQWMTFKWGKKERTATLQLGTRKNRKHCATKLLLIYVELRWRGLNTLPTSSSYVVSTQSTFQTGSTKQKKTWNIYKLKSLTWT